MPLYGSPQEALQAPVEEFLYLACLHEGTGVDAPDFLAVVDAEDGRDRPRAADAERGRRAPPLRLEPLLVGVPRPRPLAPDRSWLPLLAVPHRERRGRSPPAADREGDRAGGGGREDRLHAAAHRPLHAGRQHRRLDARRRRRQRRRRLRRPRCADLRAQGPLGERRRGSAAQLRLLVPAAQERARLDRVRGAERVRAGLRPDRRRGRPVRAADPLLESGDARARADRRSRRERPRPARGALAPRPRRRGRVRRQPRSPARCGTSTGTAPGRPTR